MRFMVDIVKEVIIANLLEYRTFFIDFLSLNSSFFAHLA